MLLIVALIFLFFYFRSVKLEIFSYWMLVLEKLGLRLDKIPNLIETIRTCNIGDEVLFNNLINLRSNTWPIVKTKKRVYAEMKVSSGIHKAFEIAKKSEDLRINTNFLSLRTEFKDIDKEIEEMGEVYNSKVRIYNKLYNFFLLKPFLKLLRFNKIPIFEFEK